MAGQDDEQRGAGDRTDTAQPNAARIYDCLLGGASHGVVDRDAARQLSAVFPHAAEAARANRAFLRRVVEYMCAKGCDQFLDLGSGVPTVGNVHEVAQRADRNARVAYVDFEPTAVADARRMLAPERNVTVTRADIREPRTVLSAPGVADLLDFSRPVGILALAVLHFVDDAAGPRRMLREYRDACPPGSYLAVSHVSRIGFSEQQAAASQRVYARSATPGTMRSREQIASLFDGYELVSPGVVMTPDWRYETPVTREEARRVNCYAGLGVLLG